MGLAALAPTLGYFAYKIFDGVFQDLANQFMVLTFSKEDNKARALSHRKPFELKQLPYARNALEPHISEETVRYHYDKHHQGYVNRLNTLTEGFEEISLEGLIMRTHHGVLYNMAAQVWNHDFYWNSMSPSGGSKPVGEIQNLIDCHFGSFDEFKRQFNEAALAHFGSGWAWLVYDPALKNLRIVTTHDADCPINKGLHPILVCDVWEHAYYIDVRNDRQKYIDSWWQLVNWNFANKNVDEIKRFR